MPTEIRVPVLGESIVDAVIANWLKQEGDTVKQGDVLVELETDKVNVDVSAEQSGVLQKITKKEGDVVTVGEVLGLIGVGAPAEPAPPAPVSSAPVPELARTPTGSLAASESHRPPSPLAKRIAAEYNVDLSQIKGNSAYGRVTREDVINYLEQSKSGSLPAPSVPAQAK